MSVSIVDAVEERFWRDLEPLIFNECRLEMASQECRIAEKVLDIERPSRILDIGCGVGRHSNYLASVGHQVEGIDKMPHLLLRAREAANKERQPVFHVGDVASYSGYRAECFDYALCFYHSLGFNPNPEDDLRILKRVNEILQDNGQLFLELIDPDGFESGQKLSFRTEIGEDIYQEEINISAKKDVYRLTIRKQNLPAVTYQAMHRLFSKNAVEELLKLAGFEVSWPDPNVLTVYEGGSRKFCVLAQKIPEPVASQTKWPVLSPDNT